MTKLNKVEGSIEKCPSCKNTIYCRTKEASGNYPAKIQWQDEDGKAHYNFDFKTNETTCKGAKTEPSTIYHQSPPIVHIVESVKWEVLQKEDYTADMQELVLGLKTMRSLAYQDAKDVHPDMAENSNVFGQIVNAGMTHLINLAEIKALKTKGK